MDFIKADRCGAPDGRTVVNWRGIGDLTCHRYHINARLDRELKSYYEKIPASKTDAVHIEDQAMRNCEKCKFRAQYDRNPRSILGRIWKWHIGWCPGWKAYLKSIPDEARRVLIERYR